MSSEEDFPQTGIIIPEDGDSSDDMNTLVILALSFIQQSKKRGQRLILLQAHAILDDVLYNLIHDIVLKAHREEKMARANTAAIIVEQLATAQPSPSDRKSAV